MKGVIGKVGWGRVWEEIGFLGYGVWVLSMGLEMILGNRVLIRR